MHCLVNSSPKWLQAVYLCFGVLCLSHTCNDIGSVLQSGIRLCPDRWWSRRLRRCGTSSCSWWFRRCRISSCSRCPGGLRRPDTMHIGQTSCLLRIDGLTWLLDTCEDATTILLIWTSGCMNRSACWRWRSGCTTVSVEIQLVFFHRPAVTANSPVVHRVHRDDLIHCLPTAKPKYLGSL